MKISKFLPNYKLITFISMLFIINNIQASFFSTDEYDLHKPGSNLRIYGSEAGDVRKAVMSIQIKFKGIITDRVQSCTGFFVGVKDAVYIVVPKFCMSYANNKIDYSKIRSIYISNLLQEDQTYFQKLYSIGNEYNLMVFDSVDSNSSLVLFRLKDNQDKYFPSTDNPNYFKLDSNWKPNLLKNLNLGTYTIFIDDNQKLAAKKSTNKFISLYSDFFITAQNILDPSTRKNRLFFTRLVNNLFFRLDNKWYYFDHFPTPNFDTYISSNTGSPIMRCTLVINEYRCFLVAINLGAISLLFKSSDGNVSIPFISLTSASSFEIDQTTVNQNLCERLKKGDTIIYYFKNYHTQYALTDVTTEDDSVTLEVIAKGINPERLTDVTTEDDSVILTIGNSLFKRKYNCFNREGKSFLMSDSGRFNIFLNKDGVLSYKKE